MNVSVQLARNSGLRVRINRKVAITAADSNKQGDVQAIEFGIPGYDDVVWDVSLVCDRIGSSTQHGLNGKLLEASMVSSCSGLNGKHAGSGLNGKHYLASMVSCNSVTTLTRRLASRSRETDVIMLPRTSLSHLQSYLSLARFILNFYVSCG